MKKKQNVSLSPDTVRERLKNIGYELYPIELDKSIQDVTVTREFMSKVYGGNSQETLPKISEKKLAVHGLNDFMYLNLDFNPHAPQVPGAPGLYFDIDSDPYVLPAEDDWPKIMRLFSRIQPKIWIYCGHYKMNRVHSLTKEEWASQSPKVRLVLLFLYW